MTSLNRNITPRRAIKTIAFRWRQLKLSRALYECGKRQPFLQESPPSIEAKPSSSNAIFIACMPKSSSTYLAAQLRNYLNYTTGHFTHQYGHLQQDICEARIAYYSTLKCVVQQHCPGSLINAYLLGKYGVKKPIVLLRRLDDVVISLYDHFHNESIIAPPVVIPSSYCQWSHETKVYFIIYNIIPWYMSFYCSWLSLCENDYGLAPIYLRYEELHQNFDMSINALIRNLEIDGHLLGSAFQPDYRSGSTSLLRFNKGKVGRGSKLNSELRFALRSVISTWDTHLDQLHMPFENTNHLEILGFNPL
jgi:hypothetical protein